MKLIKAFNIEWDRSEDQIELPTEAFFNVNNDFNVEENLIDLLEEEYNHLVNIAEYEIVAETKEQYHMI